MRKLFLHALYTLMAISLCVDASAQKKAITGKVTDSTGAPIPNVSVRLRSSRSGVATQENGSFQISANPSDVLIFSNIGFQTQEVRIGGKDNFQVVLGRDAQALGGVVVSTPVGIKRSKKSLPYSTPKK